MLHERLVNLRTQRKIKQYEVADAIGIVRSTYSAYERGQRVPDALTLARIADFYNVGTDYLLGRDESHEHVPEELIRISESIGPHESKDFWDNLIQYAKFLQKKD